MQLQSNFSDLSVVIPAFCEENGIEKTLEQLHAQLPGCEIIVVDDASTDDTAARAARYPDVIVMQHPFNQGYGASLMTGMLTSGREYVAWFDADNEHRAEDLVAMVQRIRTEKLVAVIGQRVGPSVNQFRAAGKLAIRLFAYAFNVRGGNDLNCGLRVFRREIILRYLTLLPDRYSASLTTTMLMLERGYPVRYHQINVAPRIGQSKVRMRDGFQALYKVLQLVMIFAPMRIFFRAGALLGFFGFIYGLVIAIRDREGFPTAGLLLIILGAFLIMLGLLADQISQLRLSAFRSGTFARKYVGQGAPKNPVSS